jgi:uncharacterized protein YydD (DUF2326 family)
MHLRDKPVIVSRNTTASGFVVIHPKTDISEWPLKPEYDKKTNSAIFKLETWRQLLGWLMFNLPVEYNEKYSPTFRSLISYLIRKEQFANPFENYPRQFSWDIQVHNAFLLDLNWNYAVKWQMLKDRRETLEDLKKAAKNEKSLLSSMLGSVGELENHKERLEQVIDKEEKELASFQVHPQYESIQAKANDLTEKIHQLNNKVVQHQRLIEFYENSVSETKLVQSRIVIDIYKEAGLILADSVKRHLDEVQEFHNSITQNRKSYLTNEIKRLRNDIIASRNSVERFSNERANLMQILNSHGALAEYTQLQQKHAIKIAELERIKTQIANLRMISREDSQIKIELEQLFLEASVDYDTRETLKNARRIFNENSEFLYEAPGDLIVDINKNTGYTFKVDIKRSGSDGIDKMKVFCYDLMLAELWSKSPSFPHILVHDSTIFADVDERQIARALELASRKALEFNFQYIVMLNSDKVPLYEFDGSLNLQDYVRLTLQDNDPEGSLLGIRF